tara:strand:+ start:370 stop:888 length:519 start_codon:yes stop_codon:yes gene_type:complete
MKKIFAIAITIAMFSCNTNENKSAEKNISENSSNLELAKSTLDEIFNNADYYENNESTITAPHGSKLSLQLDSIKAKLNKKDLERFNEYANNKFDKKYNTEALSNLELAKSVFDKMLENADYYENNDSIITAPYGSKLSIQLKSIKAKLSKKELETFNEYSFKKFNEKYPNS